MYVCFRARPAIDIFNKNIYKLTPRMLNAQVRVSPHAQNPKQKTNWL